MTKGVKITRSLIEENIITNYMVELKKQGKLKAHSLPESHVLVSDMLARIGGGYLFQGLGSDVGMDPRNC